MWSLLSTTKQPFTIPNILPYVLLSIPKSLLQYLTSYHMSITDNVVFVVHYQRAFTIPNILPYVHHWQCGLCCPVPVFYNTILPYFTMWSLLSSTKESFTIPNILPYVHHWQCGLCCPLPKSLLQYLTSYHMSITDNVVFVVHYQRAFYNT